MRSSRRPELAAQKSCFKLHYPACSAILAAARSELCSLRLRRLVRKHGSSPLALHACVQQRKLEAGEHTVVYVRTINASSALGDHDHFKRETFVAFRVTHNSRAGWCIGCGPHYRGRNSIAYFGREARVSPPSSILIDYLVLAIIHGTVNDLCLMLQLHDRCGC